MERSHRHIEVQQHGDVLVVQLKNSQVDDISVRAMSDEVEALIKTDGCRKMVFRLGPLRCLYSVLIARLIKLRRIITELGGTLKLCEVSAPIMDVFESCQLQDFFEFAPDVATAVASFGTKK